MPTIREVVRALSSRDGVDCVLVLGRDGLPIDSAGLDGLDTDSVAALIPSVVGACEKLGQASARGVFKTSVVESDNGYMIITAVTADTLIALFVRPATNLGSILYELRRYQSAIARLL
jgi:predicted regulator of Ras-like GTPase activity (Roadblock/LC7/MglB family)